MFKRLFTKYGVWLSITINFGPMTYDMPIQLGTLLVNSTRLLNCAVYISPLWPSDEYIKFSCYGWIYHYNFQRILIIPYIIGNFNLSEFNWTSWITQVTFIVYGLILNMSSLLSTRHISEVLNGRNFQLDLVFATQEYIS